MRSRDLGIGLFLIAGAGWLLATVPQVRAQLSLLLAVSCCLLAGLGYLGGGLARQFDRRPAGIDPSVPVVQLLTRSLLGLAVLVVGLDSLTTRLTVAAGLITTVGVAVLGMSAAQWRLLRRRSE